MQGLQITVVDSETEEGRWGLYCIQSKGIPPAEGSLTSSREAAQERLSLLNQGFQGKKANVIFVPEQLLLWEFA